MHKEHNQFNLPPKDTIIWRYMKRYKFEDILKTNELYMSRLSSMGDEFEGRIPNHIKEKMQFILRQHGDIDYAVNLDLIADDKDFREKTFISSWNKGESESYALWGLYTSDPESLAIKTTVGNLLLAFNNDEIYTEHIGEMHYHNGVDYLYSGNLFSMALQKYDYYSYENEVRVIARDYRSIGNNIYYPPTFLRPKINVKTLIDEIYLSPACRPEYKFEIENLINSHNIRAAVKYSGIKDEWLKSKLDLSSQK